MAMRLLLSVVATLATLASLPAAVQVQREGALSEGDGNFRNLVGEHFSVNQPGDYLLLRVPQDLTRLGKVVFRGDMMATDSTPCGVSMKSVTIYGQWMGDKVLHVGLHGGFGLKVSGKSPKFAGQWRTFKANWTSKKLTGREAIPEPISIKAVAEGEKAADNRTMGPAFEFHVGNSTSPEGQAAIVVAQSTACECLDVSLANLRRLGEPELGGLLGTEKHDTAIEQITPQCHEHRRNASTAKESLLSSGGASAKEQQLRTSQHASSWTTDFSIQSRAFGASGLPAAGLLTALASALLWLA